MTKDRLSFDSLKFIIHKRGTVSAETEQEMAAMISKAFGSKVEPEPPNIKRLKRIISEEISGIIAARMLADNREVPILSGDDMEVLMPMLIEQLREELGEELPDGDRQALFGFMKSMFDGTMAIWAKGSDEDPYDSMWSFVNIVLNLCDRQGVTVEKFFEDPTANDQITREYLTKERYIEMTRDAITKGFADPDTIFEKMIVPMIKLMAPEEMVDEVIEASKEKMKPMIEEKVAILCEVWGDYVTKEADRIYGS